MLIGEYHHTIDPKKRLSLPAKFRKALGETVIVTRGLDRCLFVFPRQSWDMFVEKMGALSLGAAESRSFSRFMLSSATEAEIDSAGRILIPDFLKDFAGLSSKVVVAGVNDRAEIWDEKRWDAYTSDIESRGDAVAQKLGETGLI